jgi:hypothetical protein
LVVATATTCRTSKKSAKIDAVDEDSQEQEDDDTTATDEFPHPRSATAWETKVLILTGRLPTSQELNDCEAEITALTKDATNDVGILQVEEALQKTVTTNVRLYHWCFYWMARNLDVRTDAFGLGIDERSLVFFQGMRSLWALSRALDQVRQIEVYFQYLRNRYMDMSAEVFGRPLEVITKPLGDIDGPPELMMAPGKAAGAAEAE